MVALPKIKKYFVSLILLSSSIILFGLNRNVPQLLSGVDQITDHNKYYIIYFMLYSASISIILNAIFIAFNISSFRINLVSIILTAFVLIASIKAIYVDNMDMFLHLVEERFGFNCAILLLLLFLFVSGLGHKNRKS